MKPEDIRTRRLPRETPRPRRVRLAGMVTAIRYSDLAFTLVLASGELIRGVVPNGDPDELARHFGRLVIVSGTARFRPSGTLLRVEAEQLAPAGVDELEAWSQLPVPLDAEPPRARLRQPQGPRSGINAILGAWPGDETDGEILRLLEEIS